MSRKHALSQRILGRHAWILSTIPPLYTSRNLVKAKRKMSQYKLTKVLYRYKIKLLAD